MGRVNAPRPQHTIAGLAPTVCDLIGIPRPALSAAESFSPVIKRIKAQNGLAKADKCLIYAPDALGSLFIDRHPEIFAAVFDNVPVVKLRSMQPPKTPVCFASMFTGAPPEAHGITSYQRPVLGCDTLFDALIRAGKRPAIAAVKDSSCDRIFRGRDMCYYAEEYDPQVTDRTVELIGSDRFDFILAYHQEYDDALHATATDSDRSIIAARRHAESFSRLCAACDDFWHGHDRAIVFAPDHGAHDDPVTGRGTHGEDIPEDMLVTHFFRTGRAGQ